MNLVARTLEMPRALSQNLRAELKKIDPSLPLSEVRPMADLVAQSLVRPRFLMSLTILFAGLALLLTLFGIYAITSYLVVQRTQEIGIRLSLERVNDRS